MGSTGIEEGLEYCEKTCEKLGWYNRHWIKQQIITPLSFSKKIAWNDDKTSNTFFSDTVNKVDNSGIPQQKVKQQ